MEITPSLKRRFKRVKALITDVDGVLTDGAMYYTAQGDAMKKFHTRDGMGIRLLRENGCKIAIITGEESEIVRRRAEKLKIVDLYMGVENKAEKVNEFRRKHGIALDEIAYVGDDINDIGAMEIVGIATAVADAVPAVKKVAAYITEKKGGEGAVREVADIILATR